MALLVQFNVTTEEKSGFKRAALHAGLTLSAWARAILRRAAAEELGAHGEKAPFAGQPRKMFKTNFAEITSATARHWGIDPKDVSIVTSEPSATEKLISEALAKGSAEIGEIPAGVAVTPELIQAKIASRETISGAARTIEDGTIIPRPGTTIIGAAAAVVGGSYSTTAQPAPADHRARAAADLGDFAERAHGEIDAALLNIAVTDTANVMPPGSRPFVAVDPATPNASDAVLVKGHTEPDGKIVIESIETVPPYADEE